MATPQIPPRPIHPKHHEPQATSSSTEAPTVPPRPQRRTDRSSSPHRDTFARSPLNDTTFSMSLSNISGGLYDSSGYSGSNSSLGLPQRPPSVNLPSLGHEGDEYADIEYTPSTDNTDSRSSSPEQTRNVGSDLPLYAPKPSLSTSNAKARISTVTRTDASQAAAIGMGKMSSSWHGDDKDQFARSLKAKASATSIKSTTSTERPPSGHMVDGEHGIPEIGQRVPMYPNAGDVQAPSPSPFPQNLPMGTGFDGAQKPRHHGRTRSGKEVFTGPPGSYGLHGHGVQREDKFEKAWYDKHPEAIMREGQGQYGPGLSGGRAEWALSSDDLNKIVRDTASRGSGFGTSQNIAGLPNEQIGYIATEEYASRMSSPRPQSATYQKKTHSNHSQTHVESPLREAAQLDGVEKDNLDQSKDALTPLQPPSEHTVEDEANEPEVIHIDPPEHFTSDIGGGGYDPPTEDLGPRGGTTQSDGGWTEERGYGVPILASDEVSKEGNWEYLQPAVSPAQDRRGSSYYTGVDSDVPPSNYGGFRYGSRPGSATSSRPTSRPVSIHGTLPGLSRYTSHDDREDQHKPLENVAEYEPLFPDDEDEKPELKPINHSDRLRLRPDSKRRFPSQDIWEDTPNSLQLQATVESPEPAQEQSPTAPKASATLESSETKAARKGVTTEADTAEFFSKDERLKTANFKPHLQDEMKTGMKQRFPSRDIWEDSPDSAHLEALVGDSEADAGLEAGTVVGTSQRLHQSQLDGQQTREEIPIIPPRPNKTKHNEESSQTNPAAPSLPARPLPKLKHGVSDPSPSVLSKDSTDSSPAETRKVPTLPDRPKPQIPARPIRQRSSETAPLAKTVSAGSNSGTDEPSSARRVASPAPAPKPKPILPARPGGSKIAALKSGFMSDLDKRLQIGPQAPPKPQEKAQEEKEEEEKTPLADARKSRARGPTRRKPGGISPAAAEIMPSIGGFSIVEPWTVWEVSVDGLLGIRNRSKASPLSDKDAAKTEIPVIGTNMAGEPLHPADTDPANTKQTSKSLISEHGPTPSEPSASTTKETKTDVEDKATTPAVTQSASTDIPSTSHPALLTSDKNTPLASGAGSAAKVTAHEGDAAREEGTVLDWDDGKDVKQLDVAAAETS